MLALPKNLCNLGYRVVQKRRGRKALNFIFVLSDKKSGCIYPCKNSLIPEYLFSFTHITIRVHKLKASNPSPS